MNIYDNIKIAVPPQTQRPDAKQERAPLEIVLVDQYNTIKELQSRVELLEKRLQPVLREQELEPCPPNTKPEPIIRKIAQIVRDNNSGLGELISRINNICSRLDI